MLESLIRLCEAHARLYMKSQATVFDAVTVVILMEHTLMSCLFGAEITPSVTFINNHDYQQVRDNVLSRLELDPFQF
jgi:DNA replicative helicase MCM subunit Mcm2 (Cdc46/Mcm family)